MDILRVERNVPFVYCNDSRDFQLLCRLYTAIVNGVKFDIDSIRFLTDSSKCKTEMLSLLQTKLGFFTTREYEDDKLRYILQAFPVMVKNKGSLKGVQQAVNTFLKMYDVRTTIVVYYTENSTTVYNVEVPDHTIIVGLNAALRGGVYALEDMLRYILPTGYGLYIYFYQSLEDVTTLIDTNEAVLVFVSDDINSNVRTVIDNEYVGVQVGDSIEKEDWATKAVLCSNSAMNVTIRWDVYRNKVAEVPEYLSDRYLKLVFDYDGSSWNLFGKVADPEEYGLNVSGTPSANDTITVVSAVDELIGAVDTVEVKNDLPETGNQFNVSIIDDSTQHDS